MDDTGQYCAGFFRSVREDRETPHKVKNTAIDRLVEFFKSTLTEENAGKIPELMKNQYKLVKLIGKDDRWNLAEFAEIGDYLLPADYSKAEADSFLDRIAHNLNQNPYLLEFANRAEGGDYPELINKIKAEAPVIFPDVLAQTEVIDRLTVAMHNDWRLLEAVVKLWKTARKEKAFKKYAGLFANTKLASIEGPLIKKIIRFHSNEKVDPNVFQYMLPVNIMEAVMLDSVKGCFDNACAGLILAAHNPGGNRDEVTGKGPAHFSADGKGVLINVDFAKEWADLYQTWNLEFINHYYTTPYVFSKLICPQVSGYQSSPGEYLHNRVIALFTYLHFGVFRRALRLRAGGEKIDWSDEALTKLWGQVNKESAKDYAKKVKALRNGI